MGDRTEIAGGKAVYLRAGTPADMRTAIWILERVGMPAGRQPYGEAGR